MSSRAGTVRQTMNRHLPKSLECYSSLIVIHLGATIATVIGNVVGAGYYIIYFLKGSSSQHGLKFFRGKKFPPAFCRCPITGNLLMIAKHHHEQSDGKVRRHGVAGVALRRSTMMTGMVCIGLGHGVQPLLGY